MNSKEKAEELIAKFKKIVGTTKKAIQVAIVAIEATNGDLEISAALEGIAYERKKKKADEKKFKETQDKEFNDFFQPLMLAFNEAFQGRFVLSCEYSENVSQELVSIDDDESAEDAGCYVQYYRKEVNREQIKNEAQKWTYIDRDNDQTVEHDMQEMGFWVLKYFETH